MSPHPSRRCLGTAPPVWISTSDTSTTAPIINNKQRTARCAELCDAAAALRGEKPGRGTAARRLPTCHNGLAGTEALAPSWGPHPWAESPARRGAAVRPTPTLGRFPSFFFSGLACGGQRPDRKVRGSPQGTPTLPPPLQARRPPSHPAVVPPPPAAQPSHTDGPRLPSQDPPARPPSPGGTRLPRPSSPRHLLPTGGGWARAEPVGRRSGRSSPPRSPHLRRGGELPPAADGGAVPGTRCPKYPASRRASPGLPLLLLP